MVGSANRKMSVKRAKHILSQYRVTDIQEQFLPTGNVKWSMQIEQTDDPVTWHRKSRTYVGSGEITSTLIVKNKGRGGASSFAASCNKRLALLHKAASVLIPDDVEPLDTILSYVDEPTHSHVGLSWAFRCYEIEKNRK